MAIDGRRQKMERVLRKPMRGSRLEVLIHCIATMLMEKKIKNFNDAGDTMEVGYIKETQTAEVVQHSRKTDKITPNSEMDCSAALSCSNNGVSCTCNAILCLIQLLFVELVNKKKTEEAVSYLHEAQETGLWIRMVEDAMITLFSSNSSNLGDDETGKSKAKNEEEGGNDINQVRKRPRVTCGQQVDSATQSHSWLECIYPMAIDTAITDGATNDATALSQAQEDDETTRLAAFHIADPTVAAISAIGPTHLNPYTTANVADQNVTQISSRTTFIVSNQGLNNQQADHAQDLLPPVLQPTATTGFVISATTNETAASKSSNPALVQSEPNSNANQGLAQDIIESHEFAEVRVISSLKGLHELLGQASAPNTVASSSNSTPTIDSQAMAKTRATLEMDFITMAGEVQRAHMISGIQSLVDSNCFPTGTGPMIMAMLKQLEQSVPVYSQAYSEYDMGKNLTVRVEAMKQLLQPKVQSCDSKEREFQDLAKWKMRIEAKQAAILAEIDGIVKDTETMQAQLKKLLLQQDQFKEDEGYLKAILDNGDGLWTKFKNIIHQHLPM
ncbi:hypothetical protein C1H46_006397 [Malus baccata]|uniref:Uncharacterized protein n=1 Tax=Malus baccata TaxID=106549 RepID=A0A540NAC7_MALBA|nr:hypothetical protein C1H46_006397 [Malus baccata]